MDLGDPWSAWDRGRFGHSHVVAIETHCQSLIAARIQFRSATIPHPVELQKEQSRYRMAVAGGASSKLP